MKKEGEEKQIYFVSNKSVKNYDFKIINFYNGICYDFCRMP